MAEQSNERIRDAHLTEMPVGLGEIFAKTMPSNWAEVLESRAAAGQLKDTKGTVDLLCATAVYLRQQRRACVVTPLMVERAARAIAGTAYEGVYFSTLSREEYVDAEWRNHETDARTALTAAQSVSHETGDGETGADAADPVQDTWITDSRLPIMAMSGDVESDRVLKLHFRRPVTDADRGDLLDALNQHQASLSAPTDETQGVKREPVAWRGMGPNGVPDVTLHSYIAEQWEADGVVLDFLFSLYQLESVERERDFMRDQSIKNARERNAAEASLSATREALTPSGDTKAAYHGEFRMPITTTNDDGDEETFHHMVPWTTVKEIMAAISARATSDNHREVDHG